MTNVTKRTGHYILRKDEVAHLTLVGLGIRVLANGPKVLIHVALIALVVVIDIGYLYTKKYFNFFILYVNFHNH